MGSSNPATLYYEIVLALSVVLTAVYVFKWQKHFDVHITIIFVMVPVINLGYALLSHASGVAEALAINKFIYLGGCFLGLIILLAVCTLCEVRIYRILKFLLFMLSIVVYFSALSVGYNDWFYKDASLATVNGASILVKEYGWMHTVFMYMVLCYFLGVLAVITYCFFRKNQISRKILALLFLPEIVCMISFFGGRKLTGAVELMPAAYQWSIREIMDACRVYIRETGRRVIFEYALTEGINAGKKEAEELAELLRGMQCHVNLIPLNAVPERRMKGVSEETVQAFLRVLEEKHISATRRREMGDDIEGACGQLRRSVAGKQ